MNAPFLAPLPFGQRRLGGRRRNRRRRRRLGGASAIRSPACGGRNGGGRHLRDRWVLGCDRKRLVTPGRGGCWPRRRIGGLGGVIRLGVVRLGVVRPGVVRLGVV